MAKLLLCDDEEALCRGLARLLRSAAFDVVTADGPGGINKLAEENFDIILTDLRMPGANGFDILEAARRKDPSTPVIVMSGSAEIPDAVRAIRAGARDFLIKPFEFKGLEEALHGAMHGYDHASPDPGRRPTPSPGAIAPRPGCWATIRPWARCSAPSARSPTPSARC